MFGMDSDYKIIMLLIGKNLQSKKNLFVTVASIF